MALNKATIQTISLPHICIPFFLIYDTSTIGISIQIFRKLFKGGILKLDIISYSELLKQNKSSSVKMIEAALLNKGIIGVNNIPHFDIKSKQYIKAAREFSDLDQTIKQQYTPNRDIGDTEGYELGAEWFKNNNGDWQIDDKKASYYAFVPNHHRNKWPSEIDFKTPYLELGELIFNTGKMLLNVIGLNESLGLIHDDLIGYGRMLHYQKENNVANTNLNWCGAHTDHGIFTGLIPAYYFQNGNEIDEPDEAGLYIVPSNKHDFEKVYVPDKSTLLFQVGEFGQIISNDRVKATKHLVKKAKNEIERYTFAVFFSPHQDMTIRSKSTLNKDPRYIKNQTPDGFISYKNWETASYEQYRVR